MPARYTNAILPSAIIVAHLFGQSYLAKLGGRYSVATRIDIYVIRRARISRLSRIVGIGIIIACGSITRIIYTIFVGISNGIVIAVNISVIVLVAGICAVSVGRGIGISVVIARCGIVITITCALSNWSGINHHSAAGSLAVTAGDSHSLVSRRGKIYIQYCTAAGIAVIAGSPCVTLSSALGGEITLSAILADDTLALQVN